MFFPIKYFAFFDKTVRVSYESLRRINVPTQLTFTCSKSIMETLKKGVKYVQS